MLRQSVEGQDHFAGRNLVLTVDIQVDDNTDTPYNVVTTWTRNGNPLSSDERVSVSQNYYISGINVHRTQVNFSTLSSVLDSGTYTCDIELITTSSFAYLADPAMTSVSVTITVSGKQLLFCA